VRAEELGEGWGTSYINFRWKEKKVARIKYYPKKGKKYKITVNNVGVPGVVYTN